MAAVSKELGDKVVTLRIEGHGVDSVRKLTGLTGHKQEVVLEWFRWFVGQGNASVPLTTEGVTKQRQAGASWGFIMVRCSSPDQPYSWVGEQRVRGLWEQGTDTVSQGQRIGKGGRFLGGDPELYADTLKRTGTELTKEELASHEARRQAAERQRLLKQDWDSLKAQAKELGIQVTSKATPASLAAKIQAKLNA